MTILARGSKGPKYFKIFCYAEKFDPLVIILCVSRYRECYTKSENVFSC